MLLPLFFQGATRMESNFGFLLFSLPFYLMLAVGLLIDVINIFLYINGIVYEYRRIVHGVVWKRRVSSAPILSLLFYLLFGWYGVLINLHLKKPFYPLSNETVLALFLMVFHIFYNALLILITHKFIRYFHRKTKNDR